MAVSQGRLLRLNAITEQVCLSGRSAAAMSLPASAAPLRLADRSRRY